ncbi:MAG: hypothetical protein U5J83_12970 [Bryobacterales bacterium]|nr:hypothetical protein [Bryobacterales bacterium]
MAMRFVMALCWWRSCAVLWRARLEKNLGLLADSGAPVPGRLRGSTPEVDGVIAQAASMLSATCPSRAWMGWVAQSHPHVPPRTSSLRGWVKHDGGASIFALPGH